MVSERILQNWLTNVIKPVVRHVSSVPPMKLDSAYIVRVDTIHYLGVAAHTGVQLNVDLGTVKHKF